MNSLSFSSFPSSLLSRALSPANLVHDEDRLALVSRDDDNEPTDGDDAVFHANDDCIGIQQACFYTYDDEGDPACTPVIRKAEDGDVYYGEIVDERAEEEESSESSESESDTDEEVPCLLFSGCTAGGMRHEISTPNFCCDALFFFQ